MLRTIVAFLVKLTTPVWKLFGMQPLPMFDPDTKLFAWDKLEHFLGAALLTWVLANFYANVEAAFLAFGFAVAFEIGQFDAVRSGAPTLLGEPGYGIGILDLIVGAAGAATVVIVLAFV